MDAKIAVSSEWDGAGFHISQFKTSELAIFSYYVESEGQAVLIDPTYDVNVYQDLIKKRGATLASVFLTHYHADFLSAHAQMGVPVVMGVGGKREANKFVVQETKDGEDIPLGSIRLQTIHTPGHTLESSCYLLFDTHRTPVAMFTGDTVFLGDVGRPDLAANSALTKHDLGGMLYDSVQKLKTFDDNIRVYPAHGAGSACGKAIGGGNFCTLGQQKTNNYGFKHDDREKFIAQVTNIAAPPKYFFHDSSLNQQGPADYSEAVKRANVPLSLEDYKELAQKTVIIDTRNDTGAGLIKGAYWLPAKGAIVNWLANLISPETEFLLICEPNTFEDIADRFLRIGYFNIRGYNNFSVADWGEDLNKPTIIGFPELKELKEYVHLDVRNVPEYESGVVENSVAIPLPKLPERVGEVKGKEGLVISCRTGLRARVAYSILIREGVSSTILAESNHLIM